MAEKSSYIVSPIYDAFFFIFAPLIALGLGFAIAGTPFADNEVTIFGHEGSMSNTFIGTFIMAHLVLVFFRSHGNQHVFKTHPYRFTVIPIILLVAMVTSSWVLVCMSVLATWWDVYHSSMQTFGIGRIYDMKQGNDPKVGRRLDIMCNLLLYAGPILAGATLMDHVEDFSEFEEVGSAFFTAIPAYVDERRMYLTLAIIAVAIPVMIYYVYAYWRLSRQGYKVSAQKVQLFIATAVCSVFAWGFNSFGEAFFIMNFFHALQYFALVWVLEKKNIFSLFGLERFKWGRQVALLLYLGIGFGYGLWAEVSEMESTLVFSIVILVSILHFWYDGFIWSVRKKQVS